jgi:hypothetical protein
VIVIGTLGGLLSFGMLVLSPGCSATQCTPTATWECAAGEVCYQGQCRRGCNAGNEGAMPCMSNNDCKSADLPHCVTASFGAFCSACTSNETCIPQINICQEVVVVDVPDAAITTKHPDFGLPLDGGAIDGNHPVHTHDASAQLVTRTSHEGRMLVQEITDFNMFGPMAAEQGKAEVLFWDISGAMQVQTATVAKPAGGCQVERVGCWTASSTCTTGDPVLPPADIGTIQLQNLPLPALPGLKQTLSFSFDMMMNRYAVMGNLPSPPIMLFSQLPPAGDARFITAGGVAKAGVSSSWGGTSTHDYEFATPFRLQPDMATLSMLQHPIAITAMPADLTFNFNRISSVEAIPESVQARMIGRQYRIACEEDERDPTGFKPTITIQYGLIRTFMMFEGITFGSGASAEVTLERVVSNIVTIPGVKPTVMMPNTGTTAIDAEIHYGHLFVGKATF